MSGPERVYEFILFEPWNNTFYCLASFLCLCSLILNVLHTCTFLPLDELVCILKQSKCKAKSQWLYHAIMTSHAQRTTEDEVVNPIGMTI